MYSTVAARNQFCIFLDFGSDYYSTRAKIVLVKIEPIPTFVVGIFINLSTMTSKPHKSERKKGF